MFPRHAVGLVTAALCAVASGAPGASDKPAPEELAALAEVLAPSLVRVQYTLGYDRGDAPSQMDQWMAWRAAGRSWSMLALEDWEELIRQERPLEQAGYLLAPSQVVTADPMIHRRFIKKIQVKLGEQAVDASPAGYALLENALFLKLDEPLGEGRPLSFDASAEGPYFAVTYQRGNGSWRLAIDPVSSGAVVTEEGLRFTETLPHALVIDRLGRPVGLTGTARLPVDGTWKGSPLQWSIVSQDEMKGAAGGIEAISARCLPRVTLSFRSPRSQGDSYGRYGPRGYGMDDDEGETEWNGTGVLVNEQLLMVLANFKPRRTARLERILVHTADGETIEGAFAGTLKDHGCFLVALQTPLTGTVSFYRPSILDLRDRLLIEAEIIVHGENRTAYFNRQRIESYYPGWEGKQYPAVSAVSTRQSAYYYGYGDGATGLKFLFTLDGALAAVPLERRQKVTVQEEWGGEEAMMVPLSHLREILADFENYLDRDNRPLSEEEEDRLAWLGVELQPMNPDLARINQISHLTAGGSSGALIMYVYDNSPAADAGLGMGDILLRLHVEGHPRPLEVSLGESPFGEGFPWEYYDQVPPEYFDQVPAPWGSVDNSLSRSLTELGFGTPFTAEIYRDGEVIMVDFLVTEGPPYYESAKRFKSEDLGLTVRQLTYEVRRYFQIADGEAGVIISKVEPGEKAAIAGLRPYELIISVNDQPVTGPDEFEAAIAAPGELRLFVKRMTEGRIVKVKSEPGEAGEGDP